MKLKKRIVAVAVVVALMAIAAVGTFAYVTDAGTAHNVITTGNIDIQLNYEDTGVVVVPGRTEERVATVTGQSAHDAWVRVRFEVEITDANGGTVANEVKSAGAPAVVVTAAGTDWKTNTTDDYYYYNDPVSMGETTEDLVAAIEFNSAMDSSFSGCSIAVVAYAEGVQVQNNDPEDGVLSVKGWPNA